MVFILKVTVRFHRMFQLSEDLISHDTDIFKHYTFTFRYGLRVGRTLLFFFFFCTDGFLAFFYSRVSEDKRCLCLMCTAGMCWALMRSDIPTNTFNTHLAD